jgi:hypothetical protein
MTTFTIDRDYNIAAYGPGEEIPTAEGLDRFTNPKQLEQLAHDLDWTGDQLVEIWNSFAGAPPFEDLKPVKKFTDRLTAIARIWRAIQRLAPAPTGAAAAPQTAQDAPEATTASEEASPKKQAARARKKGAREAAPAREESKTAQIITLLRRPTGATLSELMSATDWQSHSVRGFISGSLRKKMGLNIESIKRDSGERAYRITEQSKEAA